MPGKRKPFEERTAQDYKDAAEGATDLANVLVGKGQIGDQSFLEGMARSDELVDHDGETCGRCAQIIMGADVARELLEAGEYEDVVRKWATEHERRWQASKFWTLWQEETAAGRDPRKAFEERGWEP